jgi:opacity protein-like surface antigen
VQIKDNSKEGSRFRPFGHALAGVAVGKSKIDNSFFSSGFCQQTGVDCRGDFSDSETGFAAAIGGGIDIKATERFSIRAIQVDYNPTRFNGSTQNNFRFGLGVVFH